MTEQPIAVGDDRRRYYRIDDRVSLRFRVVPEDELPQAASRLHVGYPDRMSLASSFAATSSQLKHAMERARRDLPDVAACMESLNDKLDLLIQLLAASDNDLSDTPSHEVSLSASGVSFRASEPPEAGQTIEIKLLVFPEFVCVLALAEVVRVSEADGDYTVAADFTHIRENDRELLVRHVTQRQSALLREARMALEEESLLG